MGKNGSWRQSVLSTVSAAAAAAAPLFFFFSILIQWRVSEQLLLPSPPFASHHFTFAFPAFSILFYCHLVISTSVNLLLLLLLNGPSN